ncbi:MAG: NAD-dependent epimerase/dehydratase family protein [Nanoarchaeota archaeon]
MKSEKKDYILVTGGAGYLGSVLVPKLLADGYKVRVIDCFYFGRDFLDSLKNPNLEIIGGDISHHENFEDLFKGVETVIHLASISNDPSGDLDTNLTIQTNFLATMSLARRAKTEGVKKFIFASSCSVYGASGETILDEQSRVGPVTLYALSKLQSEEGLLALADSNFSVTALRFATLFGHSQRMRFDLAINVMAKRAIQGKSILLYGEGLQYRPFIHVRDVSNAIIKVIKEDTAITNRQIFNVGNEKLNFMIKDLVEKIKSFFPGIPVERVEGNKDNRSYKVGFKKFDRIFDFKPEFGVEDALEEIKRAYEKGMLGDMDSQNYYNLEIMKNVVRSPLVAYSLASTAWQDKLGELNENNGNVVAGADKGRLKCKSCGYEGIKRFLELEKMPPVNAFINPREKEEIYSLELSYCPNCFLVQLEKVVPPEKLFRNYLHLSAGSQANVTYLNEVADTLNNRFNINKESKVLEIGSNDGTLLSFFKKYTNNVLGVDPARNLAGINKEKGVDYLAEFFNTSSASDVVKRKGKFDLVVALNVIPHTPDVIDLLRGIRLVMKDAGTLVMEGVYALETILKGQFDTVYHEHVYTFSLHSLITTFAMAGLTIVDVEKIPTQGGSLRVFAMKSEHATKISESLGGLLEEEDKAGLTNPETYDRVTLKVDNYRKEFKRIVNEEKGKNGKLIGLGAPARGMVILNHCKIGQEDIDYLVDDTILKQGKIAPGVHIPVKSWSELEKDDKKAYILLSWNYKDSFVSRLKSLGRPCRIIVPFPKLEVIEFG